jgi:hypothetical protein
MITVLMVVVVVVGLYGVHVLCSRLWPVLPSAKGPQLPEAKIVGHGGGTSKPTRDWSMVGRFIVALAVGGVVVGGGWFLYMFSQMGMPQLGRPLRVRKRPWLGPRRRGAGGHDGARPTLDGLGRWRRAWLGERWLAAARAEHASVPAFEQLAAQLAQLEAPAALVERCHAARADEVRHARCCFALARAYSGVPWTGAELPTLEVGAVDLENLALESLRDGCVGEGVAADLAAAMAARSDDPVVVSSLTTIAADEARHAELAWSVVELCVARGGAPVRRALASAGTHASVPTDGPIALPRHQRRKLAAARATQVRARLATLLAA